jgi:hypothetical protein
MRSRLDVPSRFILDVSASPFSAHPRGELTQGEPGVNPGLCSFGRFGPQVRNLHTYE